VFRFVHLADVHLDTPFASRSADVRALLSGSLRESFRNAALLAVAEKVDAFLIAGDLFDRPNPSLAAEIFLLGEMRKLSEAGIPVFYATGNHDPLASRAGARRIEWPPGMTVFERGEPARALVRRAPCEAIGRVTAAGHEGAAVGDNLASRFPTAEGPLPEVALLHAAVEGTAGLDPEERRYAPCAPRDLRGRGYDYWALGHVHKGGEASADPAARYPGSLLGLDRTETGPKGVLLVEIERGEAPRVSFRETAPVSRIETTVDAGGAGSLESLRRLLYERIISLGDPKRSLLTLHLAGTTPLQPDLEIDGNVRELEESLAGETGLPHLSIRPAGLRIPIDWERVRIGPLGAALDLVAALRDEKEAFDAVAPAELAGMGPSAGREERDRYLRSLLDGAEEDLVRRMWRDEP